MKILIIGGDGRMVYLASALATLGEDVHTYALRHDIKSVTVCQDLDVSLPFFDIIILPLPLTRDGIFINAPQSNEQIEIDRIFRKAARGKSILAGKVSPSVKGKAQQYELKIFDYYAYEPFTNENAYITAEGAIEIAMQNLTKTLRHSRHLIIGAGRIAKHLLLLLQGMGASVTVACRTRHDILWAKALKAEVADLAGESEEIECAMSACDVIYNTVPEHVIPDACCEMIKPSAVFIELVGDEAFIPPKMSERAQCICAKALPARYAPESASALLFYAVDEIIKKRVIK